MKIPARIPWLCLLAAGAVAVVLFARKPGRAQAGSGWRFRFSRDEMSLFRCPGPGERGRYDRYALVFSDGFTWAADGTMIPLHEEGAALLPGRRIIPKFMSIHLTVSNLRLAPGPGNSIIIQDARP